LARIYGFSLGFDDSSRLTNISLIQAKEEALLALHNVKNKLEVNTDTQQKDVNRVMPTNKRSVLPNTPQIELIEEGVNILANPTITDQR
jgi:benzoyl-CoA reductase/2-hydroxyglutaryl-CoA dehydratase subunit BcrC/BadD/HgdB